MMAQGESFTYLAFISYNHADERFAAWLQKRLEGYRLPTATLKEAPGIPKRVRPVFRDKTDGASGVLSETLKEALTQSRKLIVICSPASANSTWVGKEVSAFVESGRYEDIVPVIVDGAPFSENECLPRALREADADRQLLGIDVPSFGKEGAFLRVVAAILGIRYDSLHRRHAQAQRRKIRAIIAGALALVLLVSGIVWQVRQQARVPTLASNLATRAISLANRDPEKAAYFALAADALHTSDETRNAEFIVAQNNRYVVSSASVASDPIREVATDGTTVLASGVDSTLTVLTYPDLEPVGAIPTEQTDAHVAYRGTNQEFVVADGGNLKFYSGDSGKVPVLVQSISLGFEDSDDVFGPYVDRLGGVLVLSSSMKGAYWSPVSQQAYYFDAQSSVDSDMATRMTAASGFSPRLNYHDETGATNEAASQAFFFATGRWVVSLHLNEGSPEDGESDFRLGASFKVERGSKVTAIGWYGQSLLVGTDAGLSQWDDVDTNSPHESAFPLAGISERVEGLSRGTSGRSSEPETVAVVTTTGVRLVSGGDAVALNGVAAVVTANSPVTAITTAPDDTWLVGRSNGSITQLDPQAKPLASADAITKGAARGVASDGTVLLATGEQQSASGVARYRLDAPDGEHILEQTATYGIPAGTGTSGVFLNAVAGDGTVVVAGGKRRPLTGAGIVLAWKDADGQPMILDFPAEAVAPASAEGFDIVSKVAYAPTSRSVAALNLLQGAVAIWSVDTGQRLHTIQVRKNPNGVFADGTTDMSSSADGELLAVSTENTLTIIETATGTIVGEFDQTNGFVDMAPDGTRLARARPDRISITDISGNEQGSIGVPGDIVRVAWSRDGSILAVTNPEYRELGFYDTSSFQQIGLPWVNPSGYFPLDVFWIDDTHLVVSNGSESSDGSLYSAQNVDVLEPLGNTYQRQLCALATGDITNDEWRSLGGSGIHRPDVCSNLAPISQEDSPASAPVSMSTQTEIGDIAFAPVPADGIHPAGRLFFGRLPLIPTTDGGVWLNRDHMLQTSSLNGEEHVLAVLDSTAGGVGWPQTLVLYGRGAGELPILLGSLPLGGVTEISAEHVIVNTLTASGNEVRVSGESYEGAGFQVRDWSAALSFDGSVLLLEDLQVTSR